jgi:large conductance mechanosensitive channel
MLKEFKDFVMRGNVLDLAIAVIIGGAFGAIVTSLINDVLMPPIGLALGHVDFKDLFLSLNGASYPSLTAAKAAGAPVLAYGQFINTITNFLVIAFVVFMVVKQANRFKKPVEAPAAPATKECPYCASAIPDKAIRCPHCTSDLGKG